MVNVNMLKNIILKYEILQCLKLSRKTNIKICTISFSTLIGRNKLTMSEALSSTTILKWKIRSLLKTKKGIGREWKAVYINILKITIKNLEMKPLINRNIMANLMSKLAKKP